jgi:hypothetical protein
MVTTSYNHLVLQVDLTRSKQGQSCGVVQARASAGNEESSGKNISVPIDLAVRTVIYEPKLPAGAGSSGWEKLIFEVDEIGYR